MTTFPALTPSVRTFSPGERLHGSYRSLSGRHSRVGYSTAIIASQLRLSFTGLSASQRLEIEDHYVSQQGEFLPFALPADLLSGFTAADFTPSQYQWRYLEPPQIEDFCGYHNATITLEAVATESAFLPGFSRIIGLSFTPGAVTAASAASGFTQTITISLAAGGVTGDDAAAIGMEQTITYTLDAGAATGD